MCGLGGLQEWPEEAIDVWPRGGCWLQDEACQVSAIDVWLWGGGWLQEWPQEAIDVWPWGAARVARRSH